MEAEEIILHPAPAASPGISIGDIFTYLPLLEKIITGIATAIASGDFTIPQLTIRAFGKKLAFGPIPIKLIS